MNLTTIEAKTLPEVVMFKEVDDIVSFGKWVYYQISGCNMYPE